jgi:hypothetical protein
VNIFLKQTLNYSYILFSPIRIALGIKLFFYVQIWGLYKYSVVRIATRYGLGGLGFDGLWDPSSLLVNGYQGQSGQGVALTWDNHLAPKSRMNTVITLLSLWGSVECYREKFNLTYKHGFPLRRKSLLTDTWRHY